MRNQTIRDSYNAYLRHSCGVHLRHSGSVLAGISQSLNRSPIKELTNEDIVEIAQTYHAWKSASEHSDSSAHSNISELSSTSRHSREGGNPQFEKYEDIAGYCKSATLEDIKANDYVLTPGRYVGAAEIEDDGIPFETKMTELSQILYSQMEEAKELDNAIQKNLEVLGYGR